MRPLALLVCLVLLAACGRQQPPIPTLVATPAPAVTAEVGTPDPLASAEVPDDTLIVTELLPGTVVYNETQEANTSPFQQITYVRQVDGQAEVTVELYEDGRVVRNGTESTLPAARLAQLQELIIGSRLMALDGTFTGDDTGANGIRYFLLVTLQDGSSRTIAMEDRFMPPALAQLVATFEALGDPSADATLAAMPTASATVLAVATEAAN